VATALFPECDWRRLRAVHGRLKRRAKPIRRKQGQLVPADDLLQLGLDLMAHATTVLDDSSGKIAPTNMRKAARDFRDGLLFALLASRPLRVKNLLGIEIGTQLRRGPGQSTLSFTEDETKQDDVFAALWPPELEAPLTRYISDIRMRLIAADPPGGLSLQGHAPRPVGASLWVAQGGTPLTPCGLRKAIARHTKARFGHVLRAHWFRDCVATTVAENAPDQMPFAARILGHSSLHTTERHYVAANSESALSRHHDLIASIRNQAMGDPERQHKDDCG
jgi:integrase/recombinase XerD